MRRVLAGGREARKPTRRSFHASIVSRRPPDDATLERTVELLLDGLAPH
jgi:hypothetical protein